MAPMENLLQEFIVNLTGGGGWGGQIRNAPGGPVESFMNHFQSFLIQFNSQTTDAAPGVFQSLFLGNPGDYAWSREGLDAIVTQLLNQMDGSGPPPLAKDKIQKIPIVIITQDQVDSSLQCSVCWEDFKVDEPVRKLSCEHVYHGPCIIPWLELHGTCPICRKTLSDSDLPSEGGGNSGGGVGGPPDDAARNRALAARNRAFAAFFGAATAGDSESSSHTSSTSSGGGGGGPGGGLSSHGGLGGGGNDSTTSTSSNSSVSSSSSSNSSSNRPDFMDFE